MEKISAGLKKKYDCIFSLGVICYCAELLTKARLRTFSAPFDWLCGASLEKRIDFLCNDFQDFLNIEDLEKTGERDHPENCDIYINKKNQIEFNHDFPKRVALEDSFPKVKAQYDKKIKRLKEKIKASKNTLIVYMDHDENCMSTNQAIISYIDRINNKFNKTTIDFLYIKHNKEMKDNEYSLEKISDNAYVAQVHNIKRTNNDLGNYKNCKRILKKIKARRNLKEMLLKISKGRTRVRVYLLGFKIMSFKVNE